MTQIRNQLGHGVIVPLVTPLRQDEAVDVGGLRRLIEFLIDSGVNGLFPMGSTGEFARLSRADWEEVISTTIVVVSGRVPVYAGVSAPGMKESRVRVQMAVDAGADAVVLSPVFYYTPNQDEICRHYESIAADSSLPLFLYNIPLFTYVTLEPQTARRIRQAVPVAGIKDSGGSVDVLKDYLAMAQEIEGFHVLVGSEEILGDALRLGVDGIVPSLANVFPHLFVEALSAGLMARWEDVDAYCAQIDDMNVLNSAGGSSLSVVAWKKMALSQLGICGAQVTEPFQGLSEKDTDLILQHLERHHSSWLERRGL